MQVSGNLLRLGCGAVLTALVPLHAAYAQNFKVLYTFNGFPDAGYPTGNLVADAQGNLYGATQYGGSSTSCGELIGCGTIYELMPDGTETVLYSFCSQNTRCSDGALPQAGPTLDSKGNLYGTTFGVDQAPGKTCPKGCGNSYRYNVPGGEEKVIARFDGENGAQPASPLLRRGKLLYGTTYTGGRYGGGTLFEIARTGKPKLLHSFGKGKDGFYPYGPLAADSSGYLYGTTVEGGGSGRFGTIFKFAPSDGTYTPLYAFCAQAHCADGSYPYGGVIIDKTGDLYGTTQYGGANCAELDGCGTVFRLAPDGTETVLHAFAGETTDGSFPFAGLLRDKQGDLYGTTQSGGVDANCGVSGGCGTVFKLAADGTETILHSFERATDGAIPLGGLIEENGFLYGTASAGSGTDNNDLGVVFRLEK